MNPDVFFPPSAHRVRASAPGRLDVMGGIADYSGSLVLQMPIRQETTVELALRDDVRFRIYSTTMECMVDVDLRGLVKKDGTLKLKKLRQQSQWGIYVIACAVVLHEMLDKPLSGADVLIDSTIPPGRGVSASAALEVATLRAYGQLLGVKWSGNELAKLGQQAENRIVGAPCGLMDQLVSCHGQPGHLLPIHCQPDDVWPAIPIPDDLHFIGIDTGVTHQVAGTEYNDARAAAFMGYTMIARQFGMRKKDLRSGAVGDNNLPWNGYLSNISVSQFESDFLNLLPKRIRGKDFLKNFEVSIDPVSTIDPDHSYPLRAATAHPIYERLRAELFISLLEAGNLPLIGELMYLSHASYTACGLGCEEADNIVNAARTAGSDAGIHGARITGGGSGGTVCLLCEGEKGLSAAQAIAENHTLFRL